MNQTISLEQLKQLPGIVEQLKAAENVKLEERQALIDEWRDCVDSGRKAVKELQAAERKVSAKVDALTDELKTLTTERNIARTKIAETITRNERKTKPLENRILAGADPLIDQFVIWAQRARNLATYSSHFAAYLGFDGDALPYLSDPQIPAIATARKIAALVDAAVAQANAMRMEAIAYADLERELKAKADEIIQAFESVSHSPEALHKDFITFRY